MTRKSKPPHADKLTFRLAPQYAERVVRAARDAGVTPNQFGRIATMAVAQNGLLALSQRLALIEEELIRLRRDFNDATRADT